MSADDPIQEVANLTPDAIDGEGDASVDTTDQPSAIAPASEREAAASDSRDADDLARDADDLDDTEPGSDGESDVDDGEDDSSSSLDDESDAVADTTEGDDESDAVTDTTEGDDESDAVTDADDSSSSLDDEAEGDDESDAVTDATEGGDASEPVTSGPRIDHLDPTRAPAHGGSDIMIVGSGFGADCRLEVDGQPTPSNRLDDTRIRFTTRPHAAGYVDVRVIDPDADELRVNALRYDPPPTIERLVPATAPSSGNVTVFVIGTGFQEGCEVKVGASCPTVKWLTATHLQLEPTAHPGGEFDVTVTNPDGSEARRELAFRFVPEPEVTAIEPSRGPISGGTEIWIRGRGFAAGAEVRLGSGPPVLAARISENELRALVPPTDVAGSISVAVANPDGESAELPHAYVYDAGPAPIIESVTPDSLPLTGGEIVIAGRHFGDGCRVTIGTELLFPMRRSPHELVVAAPPAPHGGAVGIQVLAPDGQSHTLERGLQYVAQRPPVPLSIDPKRGGVSGGTRFTLTGSDFATNCEVFVGGARAVSEHVSAAELTVVSPRASAPGTADVDVSNPDGQRGTLPSAFTYEANPPPRITDVYPAEGKATGGTSVTIEGHDLNAKCQVLLGDLRVTEVVARGSDRLQIVTPGGRPGLATLVVVAPDGQRCERPNAFQYNAVPPPSITSVSPNRVGVAGGAELEIEGRGFVPATLVLIDGKPAKIKRRIKDERLEVIVPKGTPNQLADVAVRNPDGQQAVSKRAFLYDARYG